VLLTDRSGAILLLKTHFDPEVGLPPRWITPGGGIDEGETALEAAVRELWEETGLRVTENQLGGQIWRTEGRWDWGDGINHHTFADNFFELQVDRFELDKSGWTNDEHRDVLEIRWWTLPELIETAESVAPPGLVEFLKHQLP
jgi:8-oxo-dGTP pyrophosphatase MutT (NUDIX family)